MSETVSGAGCIEYAVFIDANCGPALITVESALGASDYSVFHNFCFLSSGIILY